MDAEATFHDLVTGRSAPVAKMIGAIRQFIGDNQMRAYLVMIAVRLVELHRVLKPTGSLYLHCDPTASHYLKVLRDTIFGPTNYLNEITWKRTSSRNDAKTRFGYVADTMLLYAKSPRHTFNNEGHGQPGRHAPAAGARHHEPLRILSAADLDVGRQARPLHRACVIPVISITINPTKKTTPWLRTFWRRLDLAIAGAFLL